MRILVIAPHPDDETIGAGGTIARSIAEGDEVFLCIVTLANLPPWSENIAAIQKKQVEQVQKIYGIKQVFFLDFPTVRLNTVPNMELTSALQRVVDEVKPEIVYTSSACAINQDHRLVFDATLVATRPLPASPVRRLLCYEIGPTLRFGNSAFVPNVYVDISDFLDKKLAAMACYKTELREMPHPRSLEGIKLIARERGLSVGLKMAECFQLIREIR